MADLFDADTAFKVLEASMDISAKRHRLIANNLANVDTIGYVPKDMDFQNALKEAMEGEGGEIHRTHPNHMPAHSTPATVYTTSKEPMSIGRDPVDIDVQMTQLAENNLKYRSSVEMLLRKMGMIRHAITEGGR